MALDIISATCVRLVMDKKKLYPDPWFVNVIKYFYPSLQIVLIGPHTSVQITSPTSYGWCCIILWGLLLIFPIWQPEMVMWKEASGVPKDFSWYFRVACIYIKLELFSAIWSSLEYYMVLFFYLAFLSAGVSKIQNSGVLGKFMSRWKPVLAVINDAFFVSLFCTVFW